MELRRLRLVVELAAGGAGDPVKSCWVSVTDEDTIEHAVTGNAETLFESVLGCGSDRGSPREISPRSKCPAAEIALGPSAP